MGAGDGRRPTMGDVAEAAGVSQTTVSLVLNGAASARLAAATRDRVLRAADRLGYEFVRRVAATARKPGGLIGFMADQMSTDPWCALGLDGARAKAADHGLGVIAMVTGGDREAEAETLARLASLSVEGIVFSRIHTTKVEVPAALAGTTSVLLNCYAEDRSLPSVLPGETGAGHNATDRLLREGHRRIGFINGEAWMDASRDRLKGYKQALATADLPFDPHLVRVGNWQPTSGYEATLDLMRAERPTAIFCANDLMALGCFDALRDLGLRVPDDVSVIGFDDREIAQHLRPALTSVNLPHVEMGAAAVDLLLDPSPTRGRVPQIKIECPLVERRSVGPCRVTPEHRRQCRNGAASL